MTASRLDVNSNLDAWLKLNRSSGIAAKGEAGEVAPFPPIPLLHRVSGLQDPQTFALHGCDFFAALSKASPKPLNEFTSILDFGVGSGRLARMFKGFRGYYVGADIDHELLEWVSNGLPWVSTAPTEPRKSLPFKNRQFDCVISISVFTHMNEQDCQFYLRELQRITQPGGYLFLTIHGTRALERAEYDDNVLAMLEVPDGSVAAARASMSSNGFRFIRQDKGHLTTDTYDYGITFTGENYIRSVWSSMFDVVQVIRGGIHDFQDIVVLKRRPKRSFLDWILQRRNRG